MRRFSTLLLVVLLAAVVMRGEVPNLAGGDYPLTEMSEALPLNVVFVGFEMSAVDTDLVDQQLQKNCQFTYGAFTIEWNVTVRYHFAGSTYLSALRTVMLANSVNGTDTTSALNETALQTQLSTGAKMSIFLPQSGRAINASAVEEWLALNPYNVSLEPSYWFYVLNFTEFDSPDHTLEHWYNVTEWDFEANYHRDFWRLEWDNVLNPDVKFPYSCFNSGSRVFFIDPSAFQWYLTWARIWWGLSVSGPKYDYYYEDLDEFLRTHDVGTSQGKSDLAAYLGGWVDDAIRNLLTPELYTSTDTLRASSLSIQALIINNASNDGYTDEVMEWMINTTLVEEALQDLAPFLNVDVQVEFCTLTDDLLLEGIFDAAVIQQVDGWTYYDGFDVWYGLLGVKNSYFNFSAADIVINAYVFLEKNMSMYVYGGEYTGLGGSGQILVMKEVGRYFQEDGTSPKSGLGLVFIHEAGHNLGFPHTFIHGEVYAGDFAFDVMGYYPYSFYFSQLRKDSYQRLVTDYKTLQLQKLMDENLALYNRKPPNATMDAKFNEVNTAITTSRVHYALLRYLEAHNEVVGAEAKATRLQELLWIYLCDLDNSGTVKIFDVSEVTGAYGSEPGDSNWNPYADLIQNDEVDIFDVVLIASNYWVSWIDW
ncbi:MAG: hypothetical protein JSV35_07955 [Candidatus Bathyarchaeota archaeon]|nr:MAG: hypothetical protein JSV35_07955 [Candidatus Bathyarchaeota archaeon]